MKKRFPFAFIIICTIALLVTCAYLSLSSMNSISAKNNINSSKPYISVHAAADININYPDIESLYKDADIIVKGKAINTVAHLRVIDSKINYERAYTYFDLQVYKSYKGVQDGTQTIKCISAGGLVPLVEAKEYADKEGKTFDKPSDNPFNGLTSIQLNTLKAKFTVEKIPLINEGQEYVLFLTQSGIYYTDSTTGEQKEYYAPLGFGEGTVIQNSDNLYNTNKSYTPDQFDNEIQAVKTKLNVQ